MNKILMMETFALIYTSMKKIKAGVKAETEDLCQGGFFRFFF